MDASSLCRWRVGVAAAVKRNQGPVFVCSVHGVGTLQFCFQGIFARRGLRPCVVAAVQDCYWTVGRSVLVGNSMDLHPEKKWLAIDGRLRTVPKDNRSFGLFWSLTRTQVVTQQCHTLSCLQAVLATTSRPSNIDVQVSLVFFYFQPRYLHISLVCTPLSRLICASQKHCTIRRVRLLTRRT